MLINSATLALLTQGVQATFMVGLDKKTAPWDVLAMEVPSMTAENVYPYLKSIGVIRAWTGERVKQNLAKGEFRVVNRDYEQTESIQRNALLDDQFGVYKPRFEQMGRNVANFASQLVYGLLKTGFTALGPDGQFFFDVDHPVGKPGAEASISNFMGGAGEGWYIVDASQAVKPLIWQPRQSFNMVSMFNADDPTVFWNKEFIYGVDGRAAAAFGPYWQLAFASKQTLDQTAVKNTLVAMASQKDDDGTPLGVVGTHLVCSPTLAEKARDIFSMQFLANGATNTLRNRLTVVESPWLL
jgi:phage major head subunit gpT-like protein